MLQNKQAIVQTSQVLVPTFPDESQVIDQAEQIQTKNNEEIVSPQKETIVQKQANKNFKQIVIQNQQMVDFRDYVGQLYSLLEQVAVDQPALNLTTVVIQQLEAISEKCIKGKKQGALRQQLVYDETIQYLNSHNIILDEVGKIFLRGLVQMNFDKDENKLLKIFSDIFETAGGCIGACKDSNISTLLSNIIPIAKSL